MKKLTASTLVFALGLFAFSALAADDVVFSVSNTNNANVTNVSAGVADTGFNAILADEDVEGDAEINTGDATSESEIENDINSNDTDLDFDEADDVDVDVDNDNDADVENVSLPTSLTGDNLIEAEGGDVEGDTSINTGDADSSSRIKNNTGINHNRTRVAFDEADDVELDIDNDNDADVDNVGAPLSDTGFNAILADEDIEEGAEIETGDANSEADIENDVNSNDVDVELGDSDDVDGDIDSDNDADIDSVVTPVAVTGTNLIDAAGGDVDGGATIKTGDADVRDSVMTRQNYNVVRVR